MYVQNCVVCKEFEGETDAGRPLVKAVRDHGRNVLKEGATRGRTVGSFLRIIQGCGNTFLYRRWIILTKN